MNLNCPACGADMSLEVLIQHDAARAALVMAMGMSMPLGKLLVQYLALFRPTKRQLTMDRVAKLLGELVPMIQKAQIERNGRMWAAPLDSWKGALEEVISKRDKLILPLKSHGYLLEIIVGHENKLEAHQERKQEEQRSSASHRPAQATTVRGAMPQHVSEQLKQFTTTVKTR